MITNMKLLLNFSRFFRPWAKANRPGHYRIDFNQFFSNYLENYTKKDKRVMKQAYTKYLTFLEKNPEEKQKKYPDHITVTRFLDFLQSSSKGTGAASTYSRFKKVTIQAFREHLIQENPCEGIRCSSNDNELVKDILSEDEIQALVRTHTENERQEVRRAFLFCLYTGIRFCDVKSLRYSDFDLSNRMLSFEQSKTKGRSRHSRVHIPLRDDLLKLIPARRDDSRNTDIVFPLPSHPTCLKELRRWTMAAGIRKHITWHCARHTFATNILKNGADVKVVADLLGHSGLRYVEKYTRAVDEKKIKAINTLPPLY